MLSRDEEIKRRTEHVDEVEVIEADESSGRQSGSDSSFSLTSSSLERYSPPPLARRSTSGTGSSSVLVPPPISNVKVQVSPRFHPEPMRAGGLLGSPSDSRSPGTESFSRSKPGPTSSRATPKQASSTDSTTSPAKQNAWCNPLPGTGPSASPAGPSGLVTLSTPGTNWESEGEKISLVEDLELRFALELSLAEAQSRDAAKR